MQTLSKYDRVSLEYLVQKNICLAENFSFDLLYKIYPNLYINKQKLISTQPAFPVDNYYQNLQFHVQDSTNIKLVPEEIMYLAYDGYGYPLSAQAEIRQSGDFLEVIQLIEGVVEGIDSDRFHEAKLYDAEDDTIMNLEIVVDGAVVNLSVERNTEATDVLWIFWFEADIDNLRPLKQFSRKEELLGYIRGIK